MVKNKKQLELKKLENKKVDVRRDGIKIKWICDENKRGNSGNQTSATKGLKQFIV